MTLVFAWGLVDGEVADGKRVHAPDNTALSLLPDKVFDPHLAAPADVGCTDRALGWSAAVTLHQDGAAWHQDAAKDAADASEGRSVAPACDPDLSPAHVP